MWMRILETTESQGTYLLSVRFQWAFGLYLEKAAAINHMSIRRLRFYVLCWVCSAQLGCGYQSASKVLDRTVDGEFSYDLLEARNDRYFIFGDDHYLYRLNYEGQDFSDLNLYLKNRRLFLADESELSYFKSQLVNENFHLESTSSYILYIGDINVKSLCESTPCGISLLFNPKDTRSTVYIRVVKF